MWKESKSRAFARGELKANAAPVVFHLFSVTNDINYIYTKDAQCLSVKEIVQ